MKLNKLQRHTAYILMLAEAAELRVGYFAKFNNVEYPRMGMCHLINDIFGIFDEDPNFTSITDVIAENFPELQAKKNKDRYSKSWPFNTEAGWQERILFIQQCIIETY